MMSVEELVNYIYDFTGEPDDWLALEKKVVKIIENFSEEESAYLEESDAMECLLTICDGIRYARQEKN